MTQDIQSMREEYYENQCEKQDDSERWSVYENDGELVADWWLSKMSAQLSHIEEKMKSLKSYNDSRLLLRTQVLQILTSMKKDL